MNQISFLPNSGDFKPALPVFLWGAAFICGMYPLQGYQLEGFAGCVLLTFAWSYVMLSRDAAKGWSLPRTPVLWFAGAFWLLIAASIAWSPIKPVSLMGLCFFSVMPLGFFVAGMSAPDKFFVLVARILGLMLALMAAWAVVQFFFLNAYFLGQARHPLSDPSTLGALFSLGLFGAVGWMLSNRSAKERKYALVLSVLLIWGMMSTVARGPMFALIPGFAFFAVLLWPQVKAARKSFAILLIAALAFGGLMQLGVEKKFDLAQRLFGTVMPGGERPDISNSRMQVWGTALEMIKDSPVLGSGVATFSARYPQYRQHNDADGAYLAHNDPLQFWVELGLLGPILFYGFAIAAAVRTFRALKKDRETQDADINRRVLIVAIFAALVSMVAHSHVSFNHFALPILMPTGLLLALWLLATERALGRVPARIALPDAEKSPSMAKVAIALPFVMIGWLYGSLMMGEYFANRARDDLFAQRMDDFANHINMAGRVSMDMNARAYILAINVPMAILEMDKESKITPNIEKQKNLYAQVGDYAARISAINPLEPSPYYYLGRVQELVEKEVVPEGTLSSEDYYKKAILLDPVYLAPRLALNTLYKAEGRSVQERIINMEQGLGFTYLTPQAREYYGEMGRLYLDSGNTEKMQTVISQMMYFERLDKFSRQRLSISIPEALGGGDALMIRP